MMNSSPRRIAGAAVAAFALVLGLAACSSGAATDADTDTESDVTTENPEVEGLFDQAAADLLPANIASAGVLKVGLPTDTPPWARKPGNVIEGLIPDLAGAAGEVLGVDIELVGTAFPGLIPGIQSEQLDMAWTIMNITAEREAVLDMVSYMRTSNDFLVAKGNPKGITGVDDSLCGTIVGLVRSSVTYIPLLEEQNQKCTAAGEEAITIEQFDDNKGPILNVQTGKADSFMGIAGILRVIAAESDGALEVADANVLPGYLGTGSTIGNGVAEAIEAALHVLIEKGVYDEILAEYDSSSDALTADLVVINGIGSGTLK